jgi:hypothetical protein
MILERSDHPLPAVGDSMKIDALKRREFITLISSAVGWPLGAAAQQVKKIRRIGWLGMSTAAMQHWTSMPSGAGCATSVTLMVRAVESQTSWVAAP